jgi:hypothetical protein
MSTEYFYHVTSHTLSLYPFPPNGANHQTGTVLLSCSFLSFFFS